MRNQTLPAQRSAGEPEPPNVRGPRENVALYHFVPLYLKNRIRTLSSRKTYTETLQLRT